jgi:hypothetical protein
MAFRFSDPAMNYYVDDSVSRPHDFLGSLRAAWVMDPDGNPVEIVSRLAVTKKAAADDLG